MKNKIVMKEVGNYSLNELKLIIETQSDLYSDEELDYIKYVYKQKRQGGFDKSYLFQFVISLLIPLIGFIVGGIMIASDNDEREAAGKKCIILGIISMILSVVIWQVIK